jgi:ribosomal subunit interface protein
MKVSFTFRHMTNSESLSSYGEDKIRKLFKFEMKPSWAEIIVNAQKHHLKQIEVKVVGKDMRFVAKAEGFDIHQVLDDAIDKIARQMHKRKSKVQNHKHQELTKEYRLEHYVDSSLSTRMGKKKAA